MTEIVPDFAPIIMPHLDAAYNLARWLARDPSLAEDIVQDSFVRALRHFATFRGGDARAWLLQIVRNTAYTALRARRGGNAVSLDTSTDDGTGMEVPDPAPGPDVLLALRQDVARLDAALDRLPIELRECLVLRELEQMSYRDIATVAEVPIGTVMSRLWRARQALMHLRTESGT